MPNFSTNYPCLAPTWGVILVWLLLIGCGGTVETTFPPQTQPLIVTIAPQIVAGESAVLTIAGDGVADGTPVQVMAFGSFGMTRMIDEFQRGKAIVILSAEFTQTAGHISLHASASGYAGQTDFTIISGPPVGPLVTLVGPKTVTVDQNEWTHAAVIPYDQYLNPVADGTPFLVRASRPNGSDEALTATTNHLIAWRRIFPTTTAGRTRVATQAASSDAFGPEAVFEEVPGDPVPFAIAASRSTASDATPDAIPADGRQLVMLRTDDLFDRHGNKLADGTLVTFIVTEDNGTQRSLPSYTLDGVAELPIQASTLAGEATVYAVAAATVSDPLTLQFVRDRVRVPVEVALDGDVLTVVAGPILGELDEFLPDGTAARLVIADAQGEALTQDAVIDDGFVSAEFRTASLAAGDYTLFVFVGEATGEVTFKLRAEIVEAEQLASRCVANSAFTLCLDDLWFNLQR